MRASENFSLSNILEKNPEATFVECDPPRTSYLAVWSEEPAFIKTAFSNNIFEKIQIEVADTENYSSKEIDAIKLPIKDFLVQFPLLEQTELSESLEAWHTVSKNILTLISLGKFYPSLTKSGIDTWRIGPISNTEQKFYSNLAGALPTNSFGLLKGNMFVSPESALFAFSDSIVDSFMRSDQGADISGHDAFSVHESTLVDPTAAWKNFIEKATESAPTVRLEISLADKQDEEFVAEIILDTAEDKSCKINLAWLRKLSNEENSLPRQELIQIERILKAAGRMWSKLQIFSQLVPVESIKIDSGELDFLYLSLGRQLASVGLLVVFPDSNLQEIEIVPRLGQGASNNQMSLSSIIELNWIASVDGVQLSEDELADLVDSKRSIIRLKGKWVKLSDSARSAVSKNYEINTTNAIAASLSSQISLDGQVYELEVDESLLNLSEKLKNFDAEQHLEEPKNLTATLRPYQKRGLAWLNQMSELGLGGILADDMGLGKTIQILALHSLRQEIVPSPTLVVCPASVVGNWEKEANKFIPGTSIVRYHGANRDLAELGKSDILLTTYGVVRRDYEKLAGQEWGLLVADEAHAMKNPFSNTAKSIRKIPANVKFALTGTPIQNQLIDLWALLDWTTPGLLGTVSMFRREIAGPIEKVNDEESAQRLRTIVKPFVLRREKSDSEIAPELPPKTETYRYVPLTPEQASLYKAIAAETLNEIKDSSGIGRKGLILRLLTRLKQVCNHPTQVLDEPDSVELSNRSGKLNALTNLLASITNSGESTLIFTQYVSMGHVLERHLKPLGYKTLFLHGSLSVNKRDEMVETFQAGDANVFIISLRAGGLGINLTKATHVVHYDRWWNPAVEDQASDRAWRIGQDKPVQVHKMICEGTVEDKIASILEQKRILADSIVGSGESWISELDDQELAELVSLSEDAVIEIENE